MWPRSFSTLKSKYYLFTWEIVSFNVGQRCLNIRNINKEVKKRKKSRVIKEEIGKRGIRIKGKRSLKKLHAVLGLCKKFKPRTNDWLKMMMQLILIKIISLEDRFNHFRNHRFQLSKAQLLYAITLNLLNYQAKMISTIQKLITNRDPQLHAAEILKVGQNYILTFLLIICDLPQRLDYSDYPRGIVYWSHNPLP